MAAPLLLMQRQCRQVSLSVARRCRSSAQLGPTPLRSRLLFALLQRFHDVETLLSWTSWFKNRGLRQKNVFYDFAQKNYGNNIASAYYIVKSGGGFRFAGQSEWFRPDRRGKYNWEFMDHKDTPIEEVDVSYSMINYSGLDNLVIQRGLRSLSVRGCAEVDDWFLSRLHVFQDTLEELDISHCPRLTAGGLTALCKLRALRRLDVSSLPSLQSPGLVLILLEEMLPHCHITAAGYQHLRPDPGPEQEQEAGQEAGQDQGWASQRG